MNIFPVLCMYAQTFTASHQLASEKEFRIHMSVVKLISYVSIIIILAKLEFSRSLGVSHLLKVSPSKSPSKF